MSFTKGIEVIGSWPDLGQFTLFVARTYIHCDHCDNEITVMLGLEVKTRV